MMSSTPSSTEATAARPYNNAVTAAVPANWTPDQDTSAPTPFAAAVDQVLRLTAELARNLVGAHQGGRGLDRF